MSYMMRGRPDGQFEILREKPVLVGVFPERDMAERFIAFLKSDEMTPIDETPFETDEALEERVLAEIVEDFSAEWISHKRSSIDAVPALADPKKAPAFRVQKVELTDGQLDAAFARITANEKIGDVAADFGLTMHQLRAYWAVHCKQVQKHVTEGGQVACSLCKKAFTPSLSQPDTCARCSK